MKRLTERFDKTKYSCYDLQAIGIKIYYFLNNEKVENAIDKLGQLEDLMEKYDIKDLTELERIIVNNGTGEQAFKEFCVQNVKPYKDIEKELGNNLITLFKALNEGFYYKIENGEIQHMTKEFLDIVIKPKINEIKKYYGRITLTKEELE